MLELILFQELSLEQKRADAVVMAGDESELRTVPPEQRPEEAVSRYLKRLRSSATKKVVIAAHTDGSIVAIYELPPFSMRSNSVLTRREHGLVMVEPTKQRQGIGTQVIAALQQIFESFAYSAHAVSLKHTVDVHAGAMGPFERCGYTRVPLVFSSSSNSYLHPFIRHYNSQQHSLGNNEAFIVAEFLRKLQT